MKPAYLRGLLLAASAFAILPMSFAQGGDPHAILATGAKTSGLTGADVAPWHLKATYTFLDPAKGNTLESGTFEEWYTGPWTWHRVYTEKKLVSQEWSTVHNHQLKLKDNKLELSRLDQKVAFPLVDPVYYAEYFKPSVDMSLQAGTMEGLTLNCVLAANPSQAAGAINPDFIFPRLCFDMKDSSLHFITTSTVLTVYSDPKPFGNRIVANKVEIKPYNHLGESLVITQLEPLSAGDQAQVTPPANAIAYPWVHLPGDAPLVPVRVTECAFPMDARNAQEHGIVSVPVIIKKDGGVKDNGAAQGPPHLAQAASECVENYKFEPFQMDGEAVDVQDTIMYNYDNTPFNPSKVTIGSEPPPPPPAPAKK